MSRFVGSPQRRFDVTKREDRFKQFKPKVKRWSHQQVLDDLKGKEIVLSFLDGNDVTGKLLEADQFTVHVDVSTSPDSKSIMTYFKSGLLAFQAA
jgi:hypothetical protein